MSTIAEQYGLRPVGATTPTGPCSKFIQDALVGSTELIGIEVEVENYAPREATLNKAWTVTSDGSLRNNGAELITRPIQAMYAPPMLNYLFNQFLNIDCYFGTRTSIHVHLNVQDLTRAQALDFVLVYSVFEKLLYKFVGEGRQKNIYCVPLSDCDLLVNLIDYGETRNREWSKYTGLNTLPIHDKGTIEFRHMHGTTDIKKLSTWVNLITKLKEYVKRVGTSHIRAAIAEMNDEFDFGSMLQDIFGEYAAALVYEGPQELNYMQAKQALSTRAATGRHIINNAKTDSAFFQFKG